MKRREFLIKSTFTAALLAAPADCVALPPILTVDTELSMVRPLLGLVNVVLDAAVGSTVWLLFCSVNDATELSITLPLFGFV